jgi:mannose-6-phosphate isomerase-like protein (cupin superfamily)
LSWRKSNVESNVTHSVGSTGEDDLTLVVVYSPRHADEEDEEGIF